MRLKKIHLHGFKTFAHQTEIVFDKGITAIVGPNGSGKSNIADAIRWVMGEQAYTVMRGKKTEDMIFRGSSERSRMGMAEATITLDNTDNWLPIDYDQVEIKRRAYRSGENEYYLNGTRVRLKDVHELLDRSGLGRRTHTVIGQGMIDQALAQKPEDRRALFEEAAGITLYRNKRRQTLERLEKTQDNLARVYDIITEIAPRMRQLQRQAERAHQYQGFSHELRELLRIWYGYNWQQSLSKLVDTRAAVTHWQRAIQQTTATLQSFDDSTASLRQRQADLRQQLLVWRRSRNVHESTHNALVRDHAVGQERLRNLVADVERLDREIALLEDRLSGEGTRLEMSEQALLAISEQRTNDLQQLNMAQTELQQQSAERDSTEAELLACQQDLLDFSSNIRDRQNRIEQIKEQRQEFIEERDATVATIAQTSRDAAELEKNFEGVSQQLRQLAVKMDGLREKHRVAEERQQGYQARRADLEGQRSELDAQIRALQARFDLLDRLRAEGEGLLGGVRRVVTASNKGELKGVMGPIATLIEVPSQYELAIEIGLGARMQDIIVRSWEDAERAIAYLKQSNAGRATFLPLNNLTPPDRDQVPAMDGVLGWAADLVRHSPEIEKAIDLLLGSILVVTNLDVARQVMRRGLRTRVVTLDGDYVHPVGSVSGGSRNEQKQGGMLAREREWRQLPDQLAETRKETKDIRTEIESLVQAMSSVDEELTGIVRDATELGNQERELTGQLSQFQSRIDRARQAIDWHQQQADKLALELEIAGRRLTTLRQDIGEFTHQKEALTRRSQVLEEKLQTVSTSGLLQAVAQAQARLDATDSRRASQEALVNNHYLAVQRLQEEIQLRQQTKDGLSAEITTLESEMEGYRAGLAENDEALTALMEQMQPAQEELDQLESSWDEHDKQGQSLRERLHHEERQMSQAQLSLQRAEDHLTFLRSQIEHDFGLVSLQTEEGYPTQEPLPFDQIVTSLPRVESLPPDIQAEIRRLKSIINRLGPINPAAQSEYSQTKERHEFLTAQASDLEGASTQLRQVIGELDQLIDQEFRTTFQAVAASFTRFFTRLFGGGTAKLILTDSEDITATGVEIIARPPGKRPASLAMLSGGERALTAAALIFAILSVSPTPFCVLDEVDAALDEANVGRVRDVLKELTENAQLIIITHNRGTLEVANTIYGISMSVDSVSQSLSLKLENGKLVEAMI